MSLKSLSSFSNTTEHASSGPIRPTQNTDSPVSQGCFSFFRKLFGCMPEKTSVKQAPKGVSIQPQINLTNLDDLFENTLSGKVRGSSSEILEHFQLELDISSQDSLIAADGSSKTDDDIHLDRFLDASQTPSPPQTPPILLHADAEKNLRKHLSNEEMLRLNHALYSLSIRQASAKILDKPLLIRCRSVNSPRSFLILPTGDVYLLFNRKIMDDKLLGKGAFKKVYRAINLETGEKVAYVSADIASNDLYRMETILKEEYDAYQQNELVACYAVPNSYFVKEAKFKNNQRACYLVQRMKGDLWHGIRKGHIDLSQEEVRIDLAQQLAMLLDQYHHQHRIHRDLKPDNILYTIVDGRIIIKLSDFGLSTAMDGTPVNGLGTPMYRAPEDCLPSAVKGSYKSDSFQFGMTLAILFANHLNFKHDSTEEFIHYLTIVTEITRKHHANINRDLEIEQMQAFHRRWANKTLRQAQWMNEPDKENSIEYIIYKLLQINPKERWTASQAAEALFFLRFYHSEYD